MKEREPTILSTPGTELLPNMGSVEIKEIAYDRQTFGTRRQMRT